MEYYERALHDCLKRSAGHEPHILRDAFKMQINLQDHGTMKIDSWN